MNTTNFLLILLGATLILCFVLMLINNTETQYEGFEDPVIDAIQDQLQSESPEQLKSTVQALQQRLIDYGYAPDVNTFVKRTELRPNDGKCLVNVAEDRDKYVNKSDIPQPGPRIDLSQYVKKSSIPPEKVCPPPPEIDYSAYVKKSTLPPNEKCPPCIAPKVKVSAGLCRECPPTPECPPPQRCPEVKCPLPKPCPPEKNCPAPAPCPTLSECPKCDEIRYIKVPAVITKTVTVDSNGNVISQKIDSGNTNPSENLSNIPPREASIFSSNNNNNNNNNTNVNSSNSTSTTRPSTTRPSTTRPSTTKPSPTKPTTTKYSPTKPSTTKPSPTITKQNLLNSIFNSSNNIPTTTFPVMSSINPDVTLSQSLDGEFGSKKSFCPSSDLNSEFKSYGIYGNE